MNTKKKNRNKIIKQTGTQQCIEINRYLSCSTKPPSTPSLFTLSIIATMWILYFTTAENNKKKRNTRKIKLKKKRCAKKSIPLKRPRLKWPSSSSTSSSVFLSRNFDVSRVRPPHTPLLYNVRPQRSQLHTFKSHKNDIRKWEKKEEKRPGRQL